MIPVYCEAPQFDLDECHSMVIDMMEFSWRPIEVPVVDNLDQDPSGVIRTGDFLVVDGNRGIVEVSQRE